MLVFGLDKIHFFFENRSIASCTVNLSVHASNDRPHLMLVIFPTLRYLKSIFVCQRETRNCIISFERYSSKT